MTGASAARISVILPVYNGEKTVGRAIESLLSQTLRDFEIVAADDGSTDGTARVLAAIADSRLRVVSLHKNLGRAAARNAAAKASRGEYLAMLDADDEAYPERLKRQAEFLDSHPGIAFCGSWAHILEPSGETREWRRPVEPEKIRRSILRSNPFIHSTVMMRREAFAAAGGFREDGLWCEDYDLYLRVAAKRAAANIPEFLALYRAHSGVRYRIQEQWHQSRRRWAAIWRHGYSKSELIWTLTPLLGLFLPRRVKIRLGERSGTRRI
ncbi:MAG: glycosyltransferase family 2 protein [Elusimicrobiota bacterium]